MYMSPNLLGCIPLPTQVHGIIQSLSDILHEERRTKLTDTFEIDFRNIKNWAEAPKKDKMITKLIWFALL